MRYLSVCSGIEAVSVAWQPLGWQPAMFAEIEPFAAWLLHSRHGASRPIHMPSPNDAVTRKEAKQRAAAIRNVIALPADGAVINAGDFTKIGAEDVGTIDLLAGGTPCQTFSVAGKRAGLDVPAWQPSPSSLLDLLIGSGPYGWCGRTSPEFCRLTTDGRLEPSSGSWSNSGMGSPTEFLTLSISEYPKDGAASSLSDILETGDVPRRFFLSATACQGYPPPRREPRQDTAGLPGARLTEGGSVFDAHAGYVLNSSTGDTAHCLNAGGMGRQDYETETLITHSFYADGFDADENSDGHGDPPVPIAICTAHTKSNGRRYSEDLAYTLVRGSNQAVAFNLRARQGDTGTGEVAPTLRSMGQDAVAISSNQRGEFRERPVHGSLTTSRSTTQFEGVMQEMAVRRLTPRECERLQGFPDDYTLVEYRGKPASDGPRYKALGNSMAVPVMRWIGERIAAVHALAAEEIESHVR